MIEAGGEPHPNGDFCPYLKDRRCSIYDARPLICRHFGIEEGLCPHGCEVDGGPLSFEGGEAFIQELFNIDGKPIPLEERTLEELKVRLDKIESAGAGGTGN